ncbi:MAG TPA: tRNA (cytidine(34)-2'-O)-methyltransferase [Beijerinckiaceae bacterium]|nr:tRNA (cytidine(34)-2'-O)-methyltransferase [Beijerinckiaceae bacterium]
MTHHDSSESCTPPTPVMLALYQPDIPQNTGTIIRMAACLGVPVGIIEPAGFPASDRAFRRAGMDYLDAAEIRRHASFAAFQQWRSAAGARLLLATTRAADDLYAVRFRPGDVILFGRESLGVPQDVHDAADLRFRIPMRPELRSLNIAVSAAMITGEALRQLGAFPKAAP